MSTYPNVLVLVVDSVRARNTSLYDYTHQTTPFLESFGRSGTVYRFAYAPSTTSISSHVSLFTGLHEDEHRIYDSQRSLEPAASIWTTLRDDHGYATGVFTVNPQFHRGIGLRHGFEHEVLEVDDAETLPYPDAANPAAFDVPEWFPLPGVVYRSAACAGQSRPLRTLANGIAKYRSESEPSSEYMIDRFLDWVDLADRWAAFLNLMDAHAPYTPRPEHNRWGDEQLRTVQDTAGGGHFVTTCDRIAEGRWWHPSALEHLYDGAIRQADAMVRQVIEGLKRRGEFENTLVILTSDHGEAFGEQSRLHRNHHLFAHAPGVHEVQTHVPLVVSAPGQTEGKTIEEIASLTRLPDAIEQTVTEQFTPTAFTESNGRVLVSRGIEDERRYRLDDAFADGHRVTLPDRMYAGYERVNGAVRKYCRAGDDAATVRVYDAQESVKRSAEEPGVLAWFPGERDDEEIRAGEEGLSEDARERLEMFGYMQ
jgi:arylsulfatase A-like enzyme